MYSTAGLVVIGCDGPTDKRPGCMQMAALRAASMQSREETSARLLRRATGPAVNVGQIAEAGGGKKLAAPGRHLINNQSGDDCRHLAGRLPQPPLHSPANLFGVCYGRSRRPREPLSIASAAHRPASLSPRQSVRSQWRNRDEACRAPPPAFLSLRAGWIPDRPRLTSWRRAETGRGCSSLSLTDRDPEHGRGRRV